MKLPCIVEGLIVVLVVESIRWLFGDRIKKFSPSSLSDSISRARQKAGRYTCKVLGHVFVPKEVHYPIIHGFHLYSECSVCGQKKDGETIPYEEMVRRNKSKSL